jgi:hypothetical protein
MATQNLAELVAQLSPEEQTAVQQFIEFLKRDSGAVLTSPFLTAVDEFIAEHPELLRRLAQ